MREVSFGQYYPAKSFAHRCDPRMKILFLIGYITAIFLSKNFYALGACALAFFVVAMFSGVPFKTLVKSVKGILFLLLFMTVLKKPTASLHCPAPGRKAIPTSPMYFGTPMLPNGLRVLHILYKSRENPSWKRLWTSRFQWVTTC